MKWLRRFRLDFLLPLGLLVGVLVVRGLDPLGLATELRLKVFDSYQRIEPRPYEAAPVRIVDIDDESLARHGQWPWSRILLADLVNKMQEGGAAIVAFDIVFSEPDRTSPSALAARLPDEPANATLRAGLAALPDHDSVLATTLKEAGNVVLGMVLTEAPTPDTPAPRAKAGFAFGGDPPQAFLPDMAGVVTNLKALNDGAAGLGSFNMLPDSDAVVRRVPLLWRMGQTLYPSLTAEILRVAQGARSFLVKSSGASGETAFGVNSGINTIRIGQIEVPTDKYGALWAHFTLPVPSRYVPAWKVLDGTVGDALDGAIVLIGTSAAGLKDLRASPLRPDMPGVEAHAIALEQMLLQHYLVRPDWSEGLELAATLLLGLGLIFVLMKVGAFPSAALGAGAMALAVGASWYAYTSHKLLIDPITPAASVLAVFLTAVVLRFAQTEAEKRQVRGAFSQYLSPALVEQLAQHPERLKLGGDTREMTMLFCDVRGFTSISEAFKSDPQGLTKLINRLLTPLTDVILANRGTIDKYMGDCIMAFWNAPLDDPKHAANAGISAMGMFKALEGVNAELQKETPGLPALKIGVGINSGNVVVGNMGSAQRFDYSVLGDAVNLASRLEGQSKSYGVDIVGGETTRALAPDFAWLELDMIAVKGKAEAVRIFALLGDAKSAEDPTYLRLVARHSAMLKAYRSQRWDDAESAAADCRAIAPHLEGLYELYDERIAEYRLNPPPENWDAVYRATSK